MPTTSCTGAVRTPSHCRRPVRFAPRTAVRNALTWCVCGYVTARWKWCVWLRDCQVEVMCVCGYVTARWKWCVCVVTWLPGGSVVCGYVTARWKWCVCGYVTARWKWCLCHCIQQKICRKTDTWCQNAPFSFNMDLTNSKYERIDVHCIYAKNSLSTCMLCKYRIYIMLLGALPHTPTGALPLDPTAGPMCPNWTPRNPDPPRLFLWLARRSGTHWQMNCAQVIGLN